MTKRYIVRVDARNIEISKPSSTTLVYKFPYKNVELKNYSFRIPNNFIVYILYGKNDEGKDVLYVGKSKNGMAYRPTAHQDKWDHWTTCYVLTQFQERTFFNDGAIQFLEDCINKQIDKLGTYINRTKTTTTGTANRSDEEDCTAYLHEAYEMLDALGLDLFTSEEKKTVQLTDPNEQDVADNALPEGEYFFTRKLKREPGRVLKARMAYKDGKFTVKEGSDIARTEGQGCIPCAKEVRNNKSFVKDGKLLQDVAFDSPSTAGMLIIGASCNGWTSWKTSEGKQIKVYQNNTVPTAEEDHEMED